MTSDRCKSRVISLAVWLMPETGWPDRLFSGFSPSQPLVNFWSQYRRLIRRHRGERLAQLHNNGMPELAEKLRQMAPSGLPPDLSAQLRPPRDFVAALARGEAGDEGDESSVDSRLPTS